MGASRGFVCVEAEAGEVSFGDRQEEIDHRVTEDTEIGGRKREMGGEFDKDNAVEWRGIAHRAFSESLYSLILSSVSSVTLWLVSFFCSP